MVDVVTGMIVLLLGFSILRIRLLSKFTPREKIKKKTPKNSEGNT